MRSRLLRLALLAFVLASAPARGQVLIGYVFGDLLASKTFNMGFEIGLNFATMSGLDGAERANFTVFGLAAEWRFKVPAIAVRYSD